MLKWRDIRNTNKLPEVDPVRVGYIRVVSCVIVCIYANSGSWIDADQSDYEVRTFLLITPKAWTGSEIDVMGLYQYSKGQKGSYIAELQSEESID